MQCPVDNETLVMADRNGVEIDYCPKCRGVWLDRGELDKVIERAAAAAPAARPAAPVAAPVWSAEPRPSEPARSDSPRFRPEDRAREDDRPRREKDDDDDRRYPKRRRESFLSELFDF